MRSRHFMQDYHPLMLIEWSKDWQVGQSMSPCESGLRSVQGGI
jgi:hypothetical protein